MIELAALLLEKNNELWHIHSCGAQLVIGCVIYGILQVAIANYF